MTSVSGSAVRSRLGASALAFAAVIGTITRPGRAEDAPIELTWRAPPGCPERAAVLARVQELLGSAAGSRSALRAEASITQRNHDYQLVLVVRDGAEAGERVLVARRCEDLGGAAAVTLALLYSGSDVREPATTAMTSPTENATPTQSSEKARENPAPAPGDRRQRDDTPESDPGDPEAPAEAHSERALRVLVEAPLGTLSVGPLPSPALGVGAGVGLRTSVWSLRLLAQLSRSENLSVEHLPEYGARAQLASAGLWGCRDVGGAGARTGAVGLSGCLVLGVQYLTARGHGPFIAARTNRFFIPFAGLGAVVFWQPLEALSVLGGVNAQLELARPRLALEGVGLVRELSSTGATMFVTPEWIF